MIKSNTVSFHLHANKESALAKSQERIWQTGVQNKEEGVRNMKRHDKKVNERLAHVVEKYIHCQQKAAADNPIVADSAAKMCNIAIWEMWALMQGGNNNGFNKRAGMEIL